MMRIEWRCDKCGCSGSSENRHLKAASVNDGRIARMLHDAVSPNCRPETAEIRVWPNAEMARQWMEITAHD